MLVFYLLVATASLSLNGLVVLLWLRSQNNKKYFGKLKYFARQICLSEGEAQQPVRGEPEPVWPVDDQQNSNIPRQPLPRRTSHRGPRCSGTAVNTGFVLEIFSVRKSEIFSLQIRIKS